MLFQSIAVVMAPSANGEMIIHIPRITLAQLHPDCRGVLVRMSASSAMTMPTITLFHTAAGSCANWTTNGEMITQMPNRTFTQLAPPAAESDPPTLMFCRLSIFSLLSKSRDLRRILHRSIKNGGSGLPVACHKNPAAVQSTQENSSMISASGNPRPARYI